MEYYTVYLTSLVAFKILAALCFVIMWRYRYEFKWSGYKLPNHNLNKEFKRIKKAHVDGDSTDDEEIAATENNIMR